MKLKNYIIVGTLYYKAGIDEPWSELFVETIPASNRIEALVKANIVVDQKFAEAKKYPGFNSIEAHVHSPTIGAIHRLNGKVSVTHNPE